MDPFVGACIFLAACVVQYNKCGQSTAKKDILMQTDLNRVMSDFSSKHSPKLSGLLVSGVATDFDEELYKPNAFTAI